MTQAEYVLFTRTRPAPRFNSAECLEWRRKSNPGFFVPVKSLAKWLRTVPPQPE
jgi:hypothetical protein